MWHDSDIISTICYCSETCIKRPLNFWSFWVLRQVVSPDRDNKHDFVKTVTDKWWNLCVLVRLPRSNYTGSISYHIIPLYLWHDMPYRNHNLISYRRMTIGYNKWVILTCTQVSIRCNKSAKTRAELDHLHGRGNAKKSKSLTGSSWTYLIGFSN